MTHDFLANAAMTAVALLFCVAVIYAALADATTYRIPNWVSGVLVAGFVPFAFLKWHTIPIVLQVLLALLVFFICMVFWKLKWLGGGDVKFLGAVSLWMGPDNIIGFFIVLSVLAAIFAGLLMWLRRWNSPIQAGNWPRLIKLMVGKAMDHACPYGLPSAIAALSVAPHIFWPG